MKMLGIVAVGVVRESQKSFRAPICRAHCAVIFAIAQLSCTYLHFKDYKIHYFQVRNCRKWKRIGIELE